MLTGMAGQGQSRRLARVHVQAPFYLLKRVLGLVKEFKHQRAAELPLVIVIHFEDLLERRDVDVILEVFEYGRQRLTRGINKSVFGFRDSATRRAAAASSSGAQTHVIP